MVEVVDSPLKKKSGLREVPRLALALLGLFCCYRLIVTTAMGGVSRLLQTTAIMQSRIAPVDSAVRMTPNDPEAHYTRGLGLVNLQRLDEAVAELKEATRLRPRHYYEWLDLGVTLDRVGDQTAAIAAVRESVRLAPSFAQPRWQLGNLLYRQGRYQEAFAELRLGAQSNPNLFATMVEFAWVAVDGDVGSVEALVQPQDRRSHFQLATFLARQGKGADAARHVREAGEPADDEERQVLKQTVSALLETQQFSDAYSAWATAHRLAVDDSSRLSGQFLNGNFVDPIIQDDPGFAWQLLVVPNVSASIDSSGPSPGTKSLRFEYAGEVAPWAQLIRQLVLLQPNSRYSLTFTSRAEKLVSGGPPVILVLAAGGKTPRILGQSGSLSPGTSGWSTYNVDFITDNNTSAAVIALQRMPCAQAPCPIFGKVWLSGFSLAKM